MAPVATGPAVDWIAVAREDTIVPPTKVSVCVVAKGVEDPPGVIVLVRVKTLVDVIVVVVVRSATAPRRKMKVTKRHTNCARDSEVK